MQRDTYPALLDNVAACYGPEVAAELGRQIESGRHLPHVRTPDGMHWIQRKRMGKTGAMWFHRLDPTDRGLDTTDVIG